MKSESENWMLFALKLCLKQVLAFKYVSMLKERMIHMEGGLGGSLAEFECTLTIWGANNSM